MSSKEPMPNLDEAKPRLSLKSRVSTQSGNISVQIYQQSSLGIF
jgi:hypothetical protein